MVNKCQDIKIKYEQLADRFESFKRYAVDFRKNRKDAVAVKKGIKELQAWFENNLSSKIKVENMPSPFAEVFVANGLPVPEKETQIVELEKQMEEDCAVYRACGLEMWAEDIERSRALLWSLSEEKREQIAQEMQEGKIAIFMPGRAVQYANAVDTLTKKLKPVWLESGKERIVSDGILDGAHIIAELEKIAKAQTVGIPDEPYLMLTKPTQTSESTSMTVEAQLADIVERNAKRKKALEEFSMMPPEYAAMQKIFTMRAKRDKRFLRMNPLDKNTLTRFVSIPLSLGKFVPSAWWSSDEGRLKFSGDGVRAVPIKGVRFSGRMKL